MYDHNVRTVNDNAELDPMVHHCHRRALKNDIIDSDKIKLVY